MMQPMYIAGTCFNSIVTAMNPIGCMIGSLTISNFTQFGRWKAIIFTDFVIILGSCLNMIFNFWALIIGRLLVGWGCGAASVITPLMVNEISPVYITGVTGSMVQNQSNLGYLVGYALGFLVPYEFQEDGSENMQIYTSKVWRFIFLVPGIVALMQVIIMVTIFRDDTPVYYQQNRHIEKALDVNSKIYFKSDESVEL